MFIEKGQPETVKYHLLPTFLLAGYQEQQRVIAAQAKELRQQRTINDAQGEQLAEQRASIQLQHERMTALEERLQSMETQLKQPIIATASDQQLMGAGQIPEEH